MALPHQLFSPRANTTIYAVLLGPLMDVKMHFFSGGSKFCLCPWDESRCPYCRTPASEGGRTYHRSFGAVIRAKYSCTLPSEQEQAEYAEALAAGRICQPPRSRHELALMDEEGIGVIPDGEAKQFGAGRGLVYSISRGPNPRGPFVVKVLGVYDGADLAQPFDWRAGLERIVGEKIPPQEAAQEGGRDGLIKFPGRKIG